MTGRMAGVALAALLVTLVDAQAQIAGPKLLVRGAAANIEIIPEDRSDIVATVTPPTGAGLLLPPLEVRSEGASLIVDGRLEHRIRRCGASGGRGNHGIQVNGVGGVALSELPTIHVRAPRALVAEITNAGHTTVAAAGNGDLTFQGCGGVAIAPVGGNLAVRLDGSGDVDFATVGGRLEANLDGLGDMRGGAIAGAARLGLDGSGDISVAAIAGALTGELDGSGDIVAASASGPVSLSLDGSGDITVRGGAAPTLVARLDGSGDISFLGAVADVDLVLDGSGDIRVAHVTGQVRKSKSGSGDITIGN